VTPRNDGGDAGGTTPNAASTVRPATPKRQVSVDSSRLIPLQRQSDEDRPKQLALPGMGMPEQVDDLDLHWHANAEAVLRALAARGIPFTADQVRQSAGVPTSRNRVGILFALASQRGEIEAIAAVRSTSHSRRHGMVTLWRGAA
jgi:hypothetical protein